MGQNRALKVRFLRYCYLKETADHREDIFSFGTAVTPEVSTHSTQILQRARNVMRKIMPRTQIPQQNIAIHTHIRRGWDHTNRKWENVIWPELDCNLHALRGKSTAAWRLDRRGEAPENAVIEDP